jgi:hypothetical protein
MIGIDPEEIDYSDPSVPPGMTAEKVRSGVDLSLKMFEAEGHVATQMYVSGDPETHEAFARRLADDCVDCVTIGGGVTRPVENTELLETLLNIIASTEPVPRIALVLGPENALAAVKRVLS